MIGDIYYTFIGFLRTFGALQLFFLRMLAATPSVLLNRFPLVVKQMRTREKSKS